MCFVDGRGGLFYHEPIVRASFSSHWGHRNQTGSQMADTDVRGKQIFHTVLTPMIGIVVTQIFWTEYACLKDTFQKTKRIYYVNLLPTCPLPKVLYRRNHSTSFIICPWQSLLKQGHHSCSSYPGLAATTMAYNAHYSLSCFLFGFSLTYPGNGSISTCRAPALFAGTQFSTVKKHQDLGYQSPKARDYYFHVLFL